MKITTRVTWENERRSWGGKKEWEGKQLLPSLFPVQPVLLLINTRAHTHTHILFLWWRSSSIGQQRGAQPQPGRELSAARTGGPPHHNPQSATSCTNSVFLGTGSILEVTVTEALIPRLGKPGRFTTVASLSKRWICRAESENKGCLLSDAWTVRSQFWLCHSQWEQRFLRSGEYL